MMHLRTRILSLVTFTVCLFLVDGLSRADDAPFGADALRHLASESDIVARVIGGRREASDALALDDPTRDNYVVYNVKVGEMLKGADPSVFELRVAIPANFDVKNTEQFSNSIIFLRRMSASNLRASNITTTPEDTFLVTSGRYGVVTASVPGRVEGVRKYINMARGDVVRGEALLNWTEQYVHSADTFLQRSAVVDLYFERTRARAVEQLGMALHSDEVLPSNKQTAIKALEASGSASAVAPLMELAENIKVQKSLRETAVNAITNLPGGGRLLQRWSAQGDAVLAPAARNALRR